MLMKCKLDELNDMFIGIDLNGQFTSVLLREDFDKVYRRYEIMNEPLPAARLEVLEKKALDNENCAELESIVHQVIASHRLLEYRLAEEKLKTNGFKQKMENIVKEL